MKPLLIFLLAILMLGCGQTEQKKSKTDSIQVTEGTILFQTRDTVPGRFFDIGTIESDGSNLTMLTTYDETDKINNSDPVFSPDGSKIVYCIDSAKVSKFLSELNVRDVTDSDADGFGDNHYTLTDLNQQAYGASWISTAYGSKIGMMNESDDGIRFLVVYLNPAMEIDSIRPKTDYNWEDMDYVFSPDGSKVAFEREFTPYGQGRFSGIFTMDENGSNEKRLTLADDCLTWDPNWTNDGKQIVYSKYTNETQGFHIYIMDAEKGEADQTTNKKLTLYGEDNFSPILSPDDQYIAFSSKRDGSYDIFIMPVTGETEQLKAVKLYGMDGGAEMPCDWK